MSVSQSTAPLKRIELFSIERHMHEVRSLAGFFIQARLGLVAIPAAVVEVGGADGGFKGSGAVEFRATPMRSESAGQPCVIGLGNQEQRSIGLFTHNHGVFRR